MGKTTGAIRKILVGFIGIPLFVLGIILIPLPGPGLLVTFLALLILSLEFKWADDRKQQTKNELKKIYQKIYAKHNNKKP